MRLEVTFRNIEATDAIKDRAEKKLGRIVKHLREPVEAHLVLSVQRHLHVADLTVTASGEHFRVTEETDDMYATIDQLAQRVERVVQKHRERIIDRTHGGPGVELDGFQAGTASEVPAEPAVPGMSAASPRGVA